MPRVPGRLVLIAAAALVVGACSAEVNIGTRSTEASEEAVRLIEGRLADQAGLGPLTADCPDVDDLEAGSSFDCTGTTEDGEVVEFTATVTDDGAGEVNSTNLITPDGIPRLAAEGARVLAEQNTFDLPADAVVCDDDRGLVLTAGATLDCAVTNPQTGELVPAVITITDPSTGGFEIVLTG